MAYSFQTINNPADLTFNQLLSINNAGTIAGYFGIGQTPAAPNANPNKGYTLAPPYGPGSYTNENFPNSAQTQVTGINSFGLTVGFWVDNNTAFDNFGFVDNAGTFTSVVDPNTPSAVGAVNQLLGVNDDDQAAGFYVGADGNNHGYIYDIGAKTFTPVTIAGSGNVTATGINNEGVISGFYQNGTVTDGFIDNQGSITTLTGPSGAMSTQALGLNNEGQVVGDYTDAAGNMHGFVYSVATGTYTTIDDPNAKPSAPGAATMTVVNGINDLGQLVGFYLDANGNTDGMLAAIPGTVATIANPTAGSTIRLPAGYGGVIVQGSNPVALTDGGIGNALLQGNQGNDTITATGSGDTVITGTGTNRISLGSGQNLVYSKGNDQIISGAGADTVFASSNVVFLGAQTGQLLFIGGSGSDTIALGGEAGTIFGGAGSGNFVLAGSGPTEFVGGSGNDTFIGGIGSATVFGGTGSDQIFAGRGGGLFVGQANTDTRIVTGSGPSTVFANAGNSVILTGAANNIIVAGSGNISLQGGAASGNNALFAGSGSDQIGGGAGNDAIVAGTGSATMSGGGGNNFFGFVNGHAGGADVITDFKPGADIVGLVGYGAGAIAAALNSATVANGSTSLTLTDGTQITFQGVTNLTSSAFASF